MKESKKTREKEKSEMEKKTKTTTATTMTMSELQKPRRANDNRAKQRYGEIHTGDGNKNRWHFCN